MLEERADAILFRGRDLSQAKSYRAALEEALLAMPLEGESQKCEALIDAFAAAQKTMLRLQSKKAGKRQDRI